MSEKIQPENHELAEAPKPSRFLSWCMSSRFFYIRTAAIAYHAVQVDYFRREEKLAIVRSVGIRNFLTPLVSENSNLKSLKMLSSYVDREHIQLATESSRFPAVKNIFSRMASMVSNKIDAVLTGGVLKKVELHPCFKSPIHKGALSKPRSPSLGEIDLTGAVEVNTNYPSYSLRK